MKVYVVMWESLYCQPTYLSGISGTFTSRKLAKNFINKSDKSSTRYFIVLTKLDKEVA